MSNKSNYSPEHSRQIPPSVLSRLRVTERAEWFINSATQGLADRPAVLESSAQVAVNQAVELRPAPVATGAPVAESRSSNTPMQADVSQQERILRAQEMTRNAFTQLNNNESQDRSDYGIAA